MRRYSFHKIIRRTLIVTASVPIIILGLAIFSGQTGNYYSSTKASAQSGLVTLDSMIRDFDNENQSLIKTFVKHPVIVDAIKQEDKVAILAVIKEYEDAYDEIDSAALGLENGKMYTKNESSLPVGYDPRVRPWYKLSLGNIGTPMLTEPYLSATKPGTYSVTYALTVKDSEGNRVCGVAGVDISLEKLQELTLAVNVPEKGKLLIIDKSGTILVASDKAFLETLEASSTESEQLIHDSTDGTKIKVGNAGYLFYNKLNEQTGWYEVAIISSDVILKKQMLILLATFLLTLLMLSVAYIASKKLEGRITEPLDRLIEHMKDVELFEERKTLVLKEEAPAELEYLKNTFNDMIHRISLQVEEILKNKNEISSQYSEISALYEETTAMNDNLNQLYDDLINSNRQTIKALSNSIEANDIYTQGHCERVTKFALLLAGEIGISESSKTDLELAAILHDVGKVGIPYHILNKPGRLDEMEYELVKKHPEIGSRIISNIEFLKNASDIILQHHERFDGKGYPLGLEGSEILIAARILNIVDAYDAMTSARSYRNTPMTMEEAIAELQLNKGVQFDPLLTEAFVRIIIQD